MQKAREPFIYAASGVIYYIMCFPLLIMDRDRNTKFHYFYHPLFLVLALTIVGAGSYYLWDKI